MKNIIVVILLLANAFPALATDRQTSTISYCLNDEPIDILVYAIKNDSDTDIYIWLDKQHDAVSRQSVRDFFMSETEEDTLSFYQIAMHSENATYTTGDILSSFIKYLRPGEEFAFYIVASPDTFQDIIRCLDRHVMELSALELEKTLPGFTYTSSRLICYPYDMIFVPNQIGLAIR